jgi:hypothetical protein
MRLPGSLVPRLGRSRAVQYDGLIPMKWLCGLRRRHRPGPWLQTYQPHVERRECLTCAAWELRAVENA